MNFMHVPTSAIHEWFIYPNAQRSGTYYIPNVLYDSVDDSLCYDINNLQFVLVSGIVV